MQIIYGKQNVEALEDRYTVLELDTFLIGEDQLTAYCILEVDAIAMNQMAEIQHWKKIHEDMIHGYKTKQWSFVKDCIVNLRGKFGNDIDTFYDVLNLRIKPFLTAQEPSNWRPEIEK